MTWHMVYVGNLDDPDFHWEGGDYNGNIPKALTPGFPNPWKDLYEVVRRIEAGVFIGKQVDFAAWVAKVDKQQILAFLDERCAAEPPWDLEKLQQLRAAIDALEPNKLYALVAAGE
jgi:hypothetical protein